MAALTGEKNNRHSVAGLLRQHAQDLAKVSLRIDAIKPARTNQTLQQCTTHATLIVPEGNIIFIP